MKTFLAERLFAVAESRLAARAITVAHPSLLTLHRLLVCQIPQLPYISPIMEPTSQSVTQKNREHYDKVYAKVSIECIARKLDNLDAFLADAASTDTSWVCMYGNNFKEQLKGKRVLELGCGDCTNAAVMAALGAEVVANDISDPSGDIINTLNNSGLLRQPIQYIQGDFLEANLHAQSFDMLVVKAFLYHLDHPTEEAFYHKIVQLLKPDGEARFVEPAVNNQLLDTLHWMVPEPGRPGSLQKVKFKQWQEADPHP